MIKIPNNLLKYEDNIQSLLIKAAKKIEDYEISEYKFFNEYSEALINYVEEVFKQIATSIALELDVDPIELKKSVNIQLFTLNKIIYLLRRERSANVREKKCRRIKGL